MCPGTQKSESEFWSLSCFPVVRRRKLPEGACLGPVSSHQTLPTYSTARCRARKLPNSHGRPWTLTVSKQVAYPNNQRLLACLSINSGGLGSLLGLLPGLGMVLEVSTLILSLLTKTGTKGAVPVEIPSSEIPGMFQGFMCCNACLLWWDLIASKAARKMTGFTLFTSSYVWIC